MEELEKLLTDLQVSLDDAYQEPEIEEHLEHAQALMVNIRQSVKNLKLQ